MTATDVQFAETTKIELSRVSNISRKLINSLRTSIKHGGSHLPNLSLQRPCFQEEKLPLLLFVDHGVYSPTKLTSVLL